MQKEKQCWCWVPLSFHISELLNVVKLHLICLPVCLFVCLSACLSVCNGRLSTSPSQQSEHVDHEFAQLVVLVALLRKHFEHQQEFHVHGLAGETHQSRQKLPGGQDQRAGGASKKPSALERAKMKLASSFDNLKGRRQHRVLQRSNTDEVHGSEPKPSFEGDEAEEMRPRSSSSSSSPRNLTVPSTDAKPVVNGVDRRRQAGSFRLLRRRSPASSSEDLSGGESLREEGRGKERWRGGEGEKRDSMGSGGEQSDDQKPVQSGGEGELEVSVEVKAQATTEKTDSVVDSQPGSALPSRPTSQTPPKSPPKSPPLLQVKDAPMVTSQSFPPVYKTPARPAVVKHRSMRPKARHSLVQQHRKAFTPPSGGNPGGAKRGHRRTMSWRQELFESVTPSKERKDSSE